MADTWSDTRASLTRLSDLWRDADEDTRWDIKFWAAGLAMMAAAITIQFGWIGVLFCGGFILWWVGSYGLSKAPHHMAQERAREEG